MEQHTLLLACKHISEPARRALKRAGCEIHKDVPGLDDDIEIVELQYAGEKDLNMMSVWGIPREIQIFSKNLHLFYVYNEKIGYNLEGGKLVENQEEPETEATKEYDGELDDLEDCIF